jgi:hypothetical protein
VVDADCHWRARQVLAAAFAAVPLLTAAAIPFASAGQQPAAALEPARVALLVDTSAGTSASLTQLRAGLAAFIDALPPGPDILFVTTGRRIQVRVPPTTDRQKVKESIAGLLSDGGPTPLMDGLLEVDARFMSKAADRRSIFVIVTGDGTESSVTVHGDAFNAWLGQVQRRHASGHALVIKSGNGMPEVIASALARTTGGSFQTVSPRSPLTEPMTGIAARIVDVLSPH